MFGRKNESPEYGFLGEEDDMWKLAYDKKPGTTAGGGGIYVAPPSLVAKVRTQFFNRIDPAVAAEMAPEELSLRVTQAVSSIVDEEKLQLNWLEQSAIAKELFDDIVGIGPIEDLLADDGVTDILVNGPFNVYVERNGVLELTSYKFRDDAHVLDVARRIAASVGRRIDEASPMVDARLADGSRVNVISAPLSIYGTIISIRKFSKNALSLEDLQDKGALSEQMCKFLHVAARCRFNILISGGTGSGKTTLLNAISGLIDEGDRVVTIEDAAEICLQRPHVVSLETRQKNVEGAGEVSQSDLLRNSLRMRPDRIIIGEVRGAEVSDMLQAMNTGHDGSMSTIHANSARDALLRLENLMLSHQANYQVAGARQHIASALDLVIHLERGMDGKRHIQSISEIVGLEGQVITSQDLFRYRESGGDAPEAQGFTYTGIQPGFQRKLERFDCADRLRDILR